MHAKLPSDYYSDTLTLFDFPEEAEAYLCQHAANLPHCASMLVSPESGIDVSTRGENHGKLHRLPVHVSMLFKNPVGNEASLVHTVRTRIGELAVEELTVASRSKLQAIHATSVGDELYINERFIGRVWSKPQRDFCIFHICLDLNNFSDDIHICRSSLAAKMITATHELFMEK